MKKIMGMKKEILVCIFMLLLVIALSGCESTIQVPRDELKKIAVSKLSSEYSSAEYCLDWENYDQENKIYELSYIAKQPSSFGFTTEERNVSARFVYDPASKKWLASRLECYELKIVPNFTNIGTSFSGESPLGGTVSIQILSMDQDTSTVTLNIWEDNLTVRAENHISRPTYVINHNESGLICSYSAGVDEVIINLGEVNGTRQLLLMRKAPFLNEPQFSLFTGNNSFEGLNAILNLERR